MAVTSRLVLLAVLGAGVRLASSITPAVAQNCQPATVDSAQAQRWADSVQTPTPKPHRNPSAHHRSREPDWDVTVRTVGVPSNRGCWTAVSLVWAAPLGGALALLRPDGMLATLTPYSGIANLQAAGAGRLAFSYRVGSGSAYGAGVESVHFVVLCSFGTWHWTECLDMPEQDDENNAPEWLAPDSTVGLYTTIAGTFTVSGDSVLVHRFLLWTPIYLGGDLGERDSVDLGVSIMRLP